MLRKWLVDKRGFMDDFGTTWIDNLASFLDDLRTNRKKETVFWKLETLDRSVRDYTFEDGKHIYKQEVSWLCRATLSIISATTQEQTQRPDLKIDHVVIIRSCAIPELTNLL